MVNTVVFLNRMQIKFICTVVTSNYRFFSFFFASAFTNQDYRPALDHFFSLFFARLLSSGLWPSAQQSVFLQDISTKASHPAPAQFEDLLPAAHWVPLPRDAQVSSHAVLNLKWHRLALLYFYCS